MSDFMSSWTSPSFTAKLCVKVTNADEEAARTLQVASIKIINKLQLRFWQNCFHEQIISSKTYILKEKAKAPKRTSKNWKTVILGTNVSLEWRLPAYFSCQLRILHLIEKRCRQNKDFSSWIKAKINLHQPMWVTKKKC